MSVIYHIHIVYTHKMKIFMVNEWTFLPWIYWCDFGPIVPYYYVWANKNLSTIARKICYWASRDKKKILLYEDYRVFILQIQSPTSIPGKLNFCKFVIKIHQSVCQNKKSKRSLDVSKSFQNERVVFEMVLLFY